MSEYIERGALIDELRKGTIITDDSYGMGIMTGLGHALKVAKAIPAADVVEVKHGRWEDKPTGAYGRWQSWCTACGKHSGIGGIESNRHKPYCPNCGAKMDGE